jgi:hypothetical protein
MTKTSHSESTEQIGFVNWFENQFPGVRIFHIPNGGHRAISVAKKLKAEGVKAGVPDLFIPAWRIWIEMKRTKGGKVSKEQEEWADYLRSVGYVVIIAAGAREASLQLLQVLRARRGEQTASQTAQP